jgi:hypothetical protein
MGSETHFHGYAQLSNSTRWLYGKPRMGDLNNRMGGAFQWDSQEIYKVTTRREFSSRGKLKETSQFP